MNSTVLEAVPAVIAAQTIRGRRLQMLVLFKGASGAQKDDERWWPPIDVDNYIGAVSGLVKHDFEGCRRASRDNDKSVAMPSQGGSAGSNPVGATRQEHAVDLKKQLLIPASVFFIHVRLRLLAASIRDQLSHREARRRLPVEGHWRTVACFSAAVDESPLVAPGSCRLHT